MTDVMDDDDVGKLKEKWEKLEKERIQMEERLSGRGERIRGTTAPSNFDNRGRLTPWDDVRGRGSAANRLMGRGGRGRGGGGFYGVSDVYGPGAAARRDGVGDGVRGGGDFRRGREAANEADRLGGELFTNKKRRITIKSAVVVAVTAGGDGGDGGGDMDDDEMKGRSNSKVDDATDIDDGDGKMNQQSDKDDEKEGHKDDDDDKGSDNHSQHAENEANGGAHHRVKRSSQATTDSTDVKGPRHGDEGRASHGSNRLQEVDRHDDDDVHDEGGDRASAARDAERVDQSGGGLATSRAAPVVVQDVATKKRNQRMFGALMGHLGAARARLNQDKDLLAKQTVLERKASQKQREEAQRVRELHEMRLRQQKEEDMRQRESIVAAQRKAEAAMHTASWVKHRKSLKPFIMTQAEPALAWLPAIHTDVTKMALKQSARAIEESVQAKLAEKADICKEIDAELEKIAERHKNDDDSDSKSDRDEGGGGGGGGGRREGRERGEGIRPADHGHHDRYQSRISTARNGGSYSAGNGDYGRDRGEPRRERRVEGPMRGPPPVRAGPTLKTRVVVKEKDTSSNLREADAKDRDGHDDDDDDDEEEEEEARGRRRKEKKVKKKEEEGPEEEGEIGEADEEGEIGNTVS